MLEKNIITYQDGNILLKGYYVYDNAFSGERPVVLVAHDWSGCNHFAKAKADQLAEMGYIGFAIDMYGDGKLGQTKDEKMALIQPLLQDRNALLRRITAAYDAAKKLSYASQKQIAAIGFCFGGLCVLDLARSGADILGVVSFHGLLSAPENHISKHIQSKILVLHGHDDPMGPVSAVNAFEDEMTAVKADWQLNVYGKTMHAFMNPEANDPSFGTVYNPLTESRAWKAMQNFFSEIFEV